MKMSFKIIMLLLLCSAFMNRASAQQLASEKKVKVNYPPGMQPKMSNNTRRPPASAANVKLASDKAWEVQPSVPRTVKATRVAKPQANSMRRTKNVKLASEKKVDNEKINRTKKRRSGSH